MPFIGHCFRRASSLAAVCVLASSSSISCSDDNPTSLVSNPLGDSGATRDDSSNNEPDGSNTPGDSGGNTDAATEPDAKSRRQVIYQLPVRLFGNTNTSRVVNGTIADNGVGKFADINDAALDSLKELGVTWVYLTGVFRQATLTDWPSLGLPADDPDVVKGRAGSFFAVRDYYDVCPDYATDPQQRLREFDDLVKRIHAKKMKVMIDLTPNHVARGYKTVIAGKESFGTGDKQDVFYDYSNNFYYLQGPGSLRLSGTDWKAPSDITRDGKFEPESGEPGKRPRVTGDNTSTMNPPSSSWYETAKLNYGAKEFPKDWWMAPTTEPIDEAAPPRTWTMMEDIIAYWLKDRDVDGFRCDLVNMVPSNAMKHLISKARTVKQDAFFLAEVYADYQRYVDTGFNAVYHKDPWDALKSISLKPSISATAADQLKLEKEYSTYDASQQSRFLHFLENHDEARVNATMRAEAVKSGWGGGLRAHMQMAPLLLLLGRGPVLVFAGQEVGERAEGAEGFGADDGKTTMFDYWSLPALQGWVNDHKYDGAKLSDEQRMLRRWYAKLLSVTNDPVFLGNIYSGIDVFNTSKAPQEYPPELYSYVRCPEDGAGVGLIVSNFAPEEKAQVQGHVRIPHEALAACGIGSDRQLNATRVLDDTSGDEGYVPGAEGAFTATQLAEIGLPVTLSGRSSRVYILK